MSPRAYRRPLSPTSCLHTAAAATCKSPPPPPMRAGSGGREKSPSNLGVGAPPPPTMTSCLHAASATACGRCRHLPHAARIREERRRRRPPPPPLHARCRRPLLPLAALRSPVSRPSPADTGGRRKRLSAARVSPSRPVIAVAARASVAGSATTAELSVAKGAERKLRKER